LRSKVLATNPLVRAATHRREEGRCNRRGMDQDTCRSPSTAPGE